MDKYRKFNFFYLKEDADSGNIAKSLQEANITSITNRNNHFVLCDSTGLIHVFSRNWEKVCNFVGYEGQIPFCEISKQSNFLVTIGFDVESPSLKVWNLGKLTQNGPPCIRIDKISNKKPTALSVSKHEQFMAIGFTCGSIFLYKGDIGKDKSKIPKILSVDKTSITGISFKHVGKSVQMFICCDSGVFFYNINSFQVEQLIILDSTTAPRRCCGIQKAQGGSMESTFMVGRDDAVFCYTSDGRGPCYAVDGQKFLIKSFRSYLIIVTKLHRTKTSLKFDRNSTLSVVDVQNKFMIFSDTFNKIIGICIEFGICYLISENKKVYRLDEKDLQSKLSIMFRMNLYDIAVRIAKQSQYDSEGLAEIFRQYGDHLYNKGDYSGAVKKYNETIGFMEPSYVIKKFLDSRHINYLTDYLEAIHKQGRATVAHTTLLLNCFTRLDHEQTRYFFNNNLNSNLMFDLDVAIKICRAASIDQALSLAKRYQKHDFVISILTEDMKIFKKATEYISDLPFIDAYRCIKNYGLGLMKNSPDDTIEILKKLCTNYKKTLNIVENNNDSTFMEQLDDQTSISIESSISDYADPKDFIHLFVNSSDEKIIEFFEHILNNSSVYNKFVYNTLIEQYLKNWRTNEKNEKRLLEILNNSSELYDKSNAIILCKLYEFWQGLIILYEAENLYHIVVRYYLKNKEYDRLINGKWKNKQTQNFNWLNVLNSLRNDKNASPNLLPYVLQVVAQEKLQSPLQILNTLSTKDGPNLLTTRSYFMNVFNKEYQKTIDDEIIVEKYRSELVDLKNHIKHLREDPIDFRKTICDTCNRPLNHPAIYYLCQHSFHQDCIRGYTDNNNCPCCNLKNIHLNDALKTQKELRREHESFHNLLDRSTEPFSVISDYLRRGLF